MAKRGATSDLNHDNWDQPEEAEEAGVFKIAAQDDLQKRVIKTAKRRIKPSDSSSDAGKNIFASFGGFKPATSTKPADSNNLFGFLGTKTSVNTGSSNTAPVTNFTMASTPSTNGTKSTTPVTETQDTIMKETSAQASPQEVYLSNLQQLNRSVTDWIKTHVDTNPYCILTPVFSDYDKYLKQLQAERDAKEKSTPVLSAPATANLSSFNFVSSSTNENKFKINVPTTSPETSVKSLPLTNTKIATSSSDCDKPSVSIFGLPNNQGRSPLAQDNMQKSSFFSSLKSESTGSSLLVKPDPASLMVNPFTSSLKKSDKPDEKPFSFSNGSTPISSTKKDEEEEEPSDEPPKVEFTPVQEEGSVFSSRCKVFVKKDSNYKDRGVGTLFIKTVGENKHQLLVRAETVLGNVVLNVLLSSGIPTQRMGKNNVMLVCLPTPQDPPPPTTVLLRVKTSEEADDLLATIEKYKK